MNLNWKAMRNRANNMAKKKTTVIVKPQFQCKDCAHSYDWHSKALDGSLILCRCKLDEKTDYGKWSKFLNDKQCEKFKRRNNE